MLFVPQNQWSAVFTGIVSRATTLEILSTGVAGNYDGALQVVCPKTPNKNIFLQYNIFDIFYFILCVS